MLGALYITVHHISTHGALFLQCSAPQIEYMVHSFVGWVHSLMRVHWQRKVHCGSKSGALRIVLHCAWFCIEQIAYFWCLQEKEKRSPSWNGSSGSRSLFLYHHHVFHVLIVNNRWCPAL